MMPLGRLLRSRGFLLHWLVLYGFWWVLSGMAKPFHLVVGLICTGLIAAFTFEMQLAEPVEEGEERIHFFALPWGRLTRYACWLLKEIVLANWAVLKVVFDPALPADPAMIIFKTKLRSPLGRTLLANSITLTPGTITVDVNGDEFIVHALVADESAVAGITAIQNHIARALPGIEVTE